MLQRIILGRQRPSINLPLALSKLEGSTEPIAVISAGWQEAEGDLDELNESLQVPLVDLNLYQRAEAIFAEDKKFHSAYRQRQDRLQELQLLYRTRLHQMMIAARQIRRSKASEDLVAAEQRHATDQVRALDKHHLHRIQEVTAEYSKVIEAVRSGPLTDHINEIKSAIQNCPIVLITGGNVLVLLNRLNLFELQDLLESRHIIAWSAGAMVLSDRIVLYHDKTPLQRRDPEVLGRGMGIVTNLVFLPDARKRLLEKDRVRTGLFSDRFAPARCITLNCGSLLQINDGDICHAEDVGYLSLEGRIEDINTI